MYTAIHVLSMVIAVAFNTYYGYKLGLTKTKAALSSAFSLMLLYITMLLLAWVENGFKNFGAQNMVRTYAFAPLIFVVVCAVFKISFRKVSDMHAIWPMLLHGVSHLACIREGCCGGFAYADGTVTCNIANALTGTNMLPNQLLESVAALIIAAVMFLIAYKKKFNLNGRLFYVMIIVYGINRFFWEFLRDNDKIVVFGQMKDTIDGSFGLSNLSFYCIAMIVVGAVFLTVFHVQDQKKQVAEKVAV